MQRRKFLIGAGSLAAGGAAALGSGAVSSITADRNVNLTIEGDDDAYLGLVPGDGNADSGYIQQASDGTLTVSFDGSNDDASGGGINNQADTTLDEAFEIKNQSDRTLYVYAGFADTSSGGSSDPTSGGARSVELNAGSSDTDITFPGDDSKSNYGTTSRALGQNDTTGAIELTSGDSAMVDIRFLVYGSNDPRESDFLTVFKAVEDDPTPTEKSDHQLDVNI